jgi:succinoglycan biosynthesis transport protein ExoP
LVSDLNWNPRAIGQDRAFPEVDIVVDQPRDAGGTDVRWFIGLVRRQAKLILATMFVICVTTALILFQLTPIYSGSALIIVDPRQQSILDPDAQMALTPSDQGRVESEVEILRAPTVFLKVISELQLYDDPEFGPSPGWTDRLMAMLGFPRSEAGPDDVIKQTLEALQKATTISRVGVTYLTEIAVK